MREYFKFIVKILILILKRDRLHLTVKSPRFFDQERILLFTSSSILFSMKNRVICPKSKDFFVCLRKRTFWGLGHANCRQSQFLWFSTRIVKNVFTIFSVSRQQKYPKKQKTKYSTMSFKVSILSKIEWYRSGKLDF